MYRKVNLAKVESYIGENFLSYTEFCKRSGINMASYRKIRNGQPVNLTVIVKISHAIDVSVADLIE